MQVVFQAHADVACTAWIESRVERAYEEVELKRLLAKEMVQGERGREVR